ncbi:hypothetical protein DERF_001097 [Dermatophagoides farinae]|uniref:Uncharacterized protein n=1 Tax=Dermatophagoides farinae TaxID=6954 RepID=A0A922LCU0_DERFA|nr:hypothetical protein DERF_001097 [Dermatophagoides farinae]
MKKSSSTMMRLSKISIIIIIITTILLIIINGSNASRTCPRGCDCIETLLITNCSESSQLEYVPHTLNPALKKLYLPQNNIRRIDSAFDVYKNLIYLDLSSNLISTIVDDNFRYNNELQIILLKNNTLVTLRPKAFNGLNQLKILDLSYNRIEMINDTIFKNLNTLQILDLSYNLLKVLNENTFVGLRNLINLNISNNLITKFTTNLFSNTPVLIHLNASFNEFEHLDDNWFIALYDLTVLDLSSCHIASLSPNCFNGLNNLTILNLNNNSLMAIPSASFLPKNVIQVLNIGQNPFPFIHPKSFYHLKHLKRLYITNTSSLAKIHVDAFDGIENVEILELSNNQALKHIDANVFDNLYSLSSLILSNNSFENLQIDLITKYKKFDLYLDVRGNPFNCNCSLEWLNFHLIRMFNKTVSSNPDYFLNQNITFPIFNLATLLNENVSEIIMKQNALDVRCYSPFALKDKFIIKLHKDKFGCFLLESIIPIIIGAMFGMLIISGVIILLVIQCRNQLSGFVKNQLYYNENQRNSNNHFDLYPKPEFVFISTYNDFYKSPANINAAMEEFSVHYPLNQQQATAHHQQHQQPTTEL